MISIEKYQELKKKAEKAKADADKAEGALEQQMKKLREEFECSTIEEAETLLAKLKSEEVSLEVVYNTKLAEFEAKWGVLV